MVRGPVSTVFKIRSRANLAHMKRYLKEWHSYVDLNGCRPTACPRDLEYGHHGLETRRRLLLWRSDVMQICTPFGAAARAVRSAGQWDILQLIEVGSKALTMMRARILVHDAAIQESITQSGRMQRVVLATSPMRCKGYARRLKPSSENVQMLL